MTRPRLGQGLAEKPGHDLAMAKSLARKLATTGSRHGFDLARSLATTWPRPGQELGHDLAATWIGTGPGT